VTADIARKGLAGLIVLLVASIPAASAGAARFRVTFAGSDTLTWSVPAGPECTRSGSGEQRVVFADTKPVTTLIGQVRAPARSRVPVLVFGSAHRGGLFASGRATLTRVDETTLSPGQCDPMPAKDCGSRPLPQFEPIIWGSDSGGFALHGEYWGEEPAPPFRNCLALQTPVNLLGTETPYTGWHFGEEIPRRDSGDIATRQVSPARLRLGQTYRFGVHRIIHLTDADVRGYAIVPNGREGPAEVLGGEKTITDDISWQITLKRVG
jgi:hypothetical protein